MIRRSLARKDDFRFHVIVHHQGKPGKERKHRPQRNTDYCTVLLHMLSSSPLSLEIAPPTVALALLHHGSLIKKMLSKTCPQASLIQAIIYLKFLSPGCVKFTTKLNRTRTGVLGTSARKDDGQTLVLLYVRKSLTQDAYVLWHQANLLAYRRGKIIDS